MQLIKSIILTDCSVVNIRCKFAHRLLNIHWHLVTATCRQLHCIGWRLLIYDSTRRWGNRERQSSRFRLFSIKSPASIPSYAISGCTPTRRKVAWRCCIAELVSDKMPAQSILLNHLPLDEQSLGSTRAEFEGKRDFGVCGPCTCVHRQNVVISSPVGGLTSCKRSAHPRDRSSAR